MAALGADADGGGPDEQPFARWMTHRLNVAGLDTDVLSTYILTLLQAGWNTSNTEVDSAHATEVLELLQSAAQTSEDSSGLCNELVSQYARFKCGEALPEVRTSRWSFASTPPLAPKSAQNKSKKPPVQAKSNGVHSDLNSARLDSRNSQADSGPDKTQTDLPSLSAGAQEFVPTFAARSDPNPEPSIYPVESHERQYSEFGEIPMGDGLFPMQNASTMGPSDVRMESSHISSEYGQIPSHSEMFSSLSSGFVGHVNSQNPNFPARPRTNVRTDIGYSIVGSGLMCGSHELGLVAHEASLSEPFSSLKEPSGKSQFLDVQHRAVDQPAHQTHQMGNHPAGRWDDDGLGKESLQAQMRRLLTTLQDFSPEDLANLLSLEDSDLEKVLLLLLDRSDLEEDPEDEGRNHRKTPCKYFMQGRCHRSDCWFSHDLGSIPCKFFAAGWCQYEDRCTFSHDERTLVLSAMKLLRDESLDVFVVPETPSAALPTEVQVPKMDESSFPALGVSNPPSEGVSITKRSDVGDFDASSAATADSLASKLKLKQLKAMFPTVWGDTVEDIFISCNYEIQSAEKLLKEKCPGTYVAPPTAMSTALAPPPLSVKAGGRLHQVVDWVETGSALGSKYQKLREDAIEHAKLRNKFFQEATAAFLRGDKRAATALSKQGRHHDHEMKEQHRLAADEMFASRNASNLPENVIDLHGLHVQEALSYLEVLLEKLEHRYATCLVITGTGHHSFHHHLSERQQTRLAPAILTYLQSNGYKYKDASTKHGGVGGMYEVQLTLS